MGGFSVPAPAGAEAIPAGLDGAGAAVGGAGGGAVAIGPAAGTEPAAPGGGAAMFGRFACTPTNGGAPRLAEAKEGGTEDDAGTDDESSVAGNGATGPGPASAV